MENDVVRVHPDLAIACRPNHSPEYRLWLIGRYLDYRGVGWHPIEYLRYTLTDEDSELRLYTWRNMRYILSNGDGLFWTVYRVEDSQEYNKVYLKSVHHLAHHFSLKGFNKRRTIDMPANALFNGGIATFRAYIYDSFLATYDSKQFIPRSKITSSTQIGKRSQRRYEKLLQDKDD